MEIEYGKARTDPHAKKWFMDWRFDDHFARDQMLLGFELSNRSSSSPSVADLLQNCDLPPPLKLFSPVAEEDHKKKKTSIHPSLPHGSSPSPTPSKAANKGEDHELGLMDHGKESLSLLRALQRSQTRAREAEKKASLQSIKNEEIVRLVLKDSLKLSAYKQWMKLLEIEISVLQRKRSRLREEEEQLRDNGGDAVGWWLTLAFCLSIAAGVGFAMGLCVLS